MNEVTTKKEPRKVTMEDGTEVNFGTRMTVKAAFDEDTNEIRFNLLNGRVIKWMPSFLPSLEGLVKTVSFYGLMERVKSVYGPIKELDKIEEAINRVISTIDSGVFPLRGSAEDSESELTIWQKAYALAKAQREPEQFAHWASVDNPQVIEEVLAKWETFSRANVQEIRRNHWVKHFHLELEKASSDVAEETLL